MIDTLMPILSESYLLIIPLIIIYLIYNKDKKVYSLLLALILTLVIVTAIKAAVVAPRPCIDLVGECDNPLDSFPSRHVALVSVLLVFLWNKKPLFGAYSVYVLLIAWSRIHLGEHYPHEVLAGAVIGIIIGYICLKIAKKLGMEKRVV